jgi:hypothetical protein
MWSIKFPRFGRLIDDAGQPVDEWIEVTGQGVPAHVGRESDDDPFSDFLPALEGEPPPFDRPGELPRVLAAIERGSPGRHILVEPDCREPLRAMVIVAEDALEKSGQRYLRPLLVLPGTEYAALSFRELHARICDALIRRG